MSTQLQTIKDEWHAKRSENVGASEVAALFGLSPYMSRFTLWHMKAGSLAAPDFDNERVRWGNRLEAAIAYGLAEDFGLKIRKVHRYIPHPVIGGMGASLDFEIFNHPGGPAVFEIKNVDAAVFHANWVTEGPVIMEAPLHIELQLQHQMAVTGRQWGAIGCLVGGNRSYLLTRKRREDVIAKLENAVADFWLSIRDDKAPSITDAGDLETVMAMFDGTQAVEAEDPVFFATLVEDFKAAQDIEKEVKQNTDVVKARLIDYLSMQDAEVMTGGGYQVSYKEQERAAYMVEASSYRVLRTKQQKGARDGNE